MTAPFADFSLPPEKEEALRKAQWLEWTSIGFMISIIIVVGLAMGASQTMKAMWIEDTVSLIPSVAFLLGAYFCTKPPDDRFPYGYRRAILIAYLAGSVALFGFGVYILGDSAVKLISGERPTIGTVRVFGHRIWLGWLMMAALSYSVIPPIVLGRIKIGLARELNDKALHTSAKINKGDWLSGIAGVAGLLGIAYGFWWADSAAAGFISFEIVRDGCSSLANSVKQLMNMRPSDLESREKDPLMDRVQTALEDLAWVEKARVRLREDGDVLTGEAFVVPRDEAKILSRMKQATELVHGLDWRLHDVNIVPLAALE